MDSALITMFLDNNMTREEAIKIIKEFISGTCLHLVDQEALKTLIPELRENDDESIREDLIDGLMWQRDNLETIGPHDNNNILPGFCFPVSEHLAYLERQKPRKFKLGDKVSYWCDDDTNVITITGFRDDAYLTDSAYGPILFSDEDNWDRIEQKDYRKLYEDIAKSEWFKRAYKGKSLGEEFEQKEQKEESLRDFIDDFPYSDEQKEQKHYWKPTETDVALFNKAVTTNKTLTPAERAQLDIIRSKFGCCRASNCSGIVQKEQKPILEVFGFKVGDAVRLKDGDGRKHIIKSFEEVEGLHGPNFYHVEFEDNSARDSICPGKEYPNGYYTQMEKIDDAQKPTEWSKEDEEMYARIVRRYTDYEGVIMRTKEESVAAKMLDAMAQEEIWLKSLYLNLKKKNDDIAKLCSNKWSEEDEDAINGAIGILLDDNCPTFVFPEHSKFSVGEIVKRLKSLRSKSHWKPSKEQMDALRDIIETVPMTCRQQISLESLNSDLKKL